MMHKLLLLNDVHSGADEFTRLVGSKDIPASEQGLEESIQIAKAFTEKAPKKIDVVVCSSASRISRMVHWIRMLSKGEYLTRKKIKITDALKERGFGVFEGTLYSFTSEIFTHSRICAEGGESVAECRDRSVYFLKTFFEKADQTVLAVAHPFVCQIITNFFLGKAITHISPFWHIKGSSVVLKKEDKEPGWKFDKAVNYRTGLEYGLEELYS